MKRSFKKYLVFSLAFPLAIFTELAFGAEAQLPDCRNPKPTIEKRGERLRPLEFKSPDTLHLIVFSRPISSMEPDMPYWAKIEVVNTKNGHRAIIEDPPHVAQAGYEAFQPYENGLWSPDGRYLPVWRVSDIKANTVTIGFLDVCTGLWEGFEGEKDVATTDNFAGWEKKKPHTMLLIGTPPGPEYTEAHPINERDPADCR
jgi:hypothetical protein